MSRVHERKRIYEFLDGRLSERGYARLEEHLKTCDTCREHLEQVRDTRSILASMGDEPPEVDTDRVRRALRDVTDQPVPRNVVQLWSRRALGAAVMAAAAVLVVVLLNPLFAPDEDQTLVRGNPDHPVAVTRTLADATNTTGRLTIVGQGTMWRRPGLHWETADLHTTVSADTELETGERAVASMQIAPLSGVRMEPGTRMSVRTMVRDSVELDLERGTVSVTVSEDSGLRNVQVDTQQAVVRVSGTTLSVEKRGSVTRVVVSRGRVHVQPLAGGDEMILVGPAVAEVDERGVRELDDPEVDGEDPAVSWLSTLHFNLFEKPPVDQEVTFAPQGDGGDVTVSMSGLVTGPAPLSMLAPVGIKEATLSFGDGSSLKTSFSVEGTGTTVVTFTPPHIDVTPAQPAHKSVKPKLAAKEAQVEDTAEEPEQVHEGTLHPQIVKLVMKKHRGRLRDCYEKYLDGEPEVIKVKARILFTVGTSGKVVDSSVETNAGDPSLETCLSGAMKNVIFPPPSGGTVQFAYPITFTPK